LAWWMMHHSSREKYTFQPCGLAQILEPWSSTTSPLINRTLVG
jgi:hypothetical protein